MELLELVRLEMLRRVACWCGARVLRFLFVAVAALAALLAGLLSRPALVG